jgi:hypothetical protein
VICAADSPTRAKAFSRPRTSAPIPGPRSELCSGFSPSISVPVAGTWFSTRDPLGVLQSADKLVKAVAFLLDVFVCICSCSCVLIDGSVY